MKQLRKRIGRLLMSAFIFLFIVPALLFSVLVLELTESKKSGTAMLVAMLILILTVMIYDLTRHAPSRKEAPPSLQDIYRELGYADTDEEQTDRRPSREEGVGNG